MTTSNIYTCNFCRKQFNRLKKSRGHHKTCNKNPDNINNKYHCTPCEKSFSTGSAHNKHIKTCPHNIIKESYSCCNCNKEFLGKKITSKYCSRECLSLYKKKLKYDLFSEIKNEVLKLSNLGYSMCKIAEIINRKDVNHMTVHSVKKLIEKGSL